MKTITDNVGNEWRYDEDALIGEGGTASVYSGESVSGEPVAVKVVDAGSGSLALAIHSREVEIGALVQAASSRQHLMVNLGTAQSDQQILIVMPRATTNLDTYMRTAEVPYAEKLDIIRQVALGLQELAEINVAHRDLNPRNIMQVEGRWCLADFGISRELTASTSLLTRNMEGSWEYTAPEVFGNWRATTKTDLYSLGVVSYQLLTGSLPFQGSDVAELMRAHQEAPPPPMSDDIPVPIQHIVLRLLEKKPGHRFEDARAVVAALNDAATGKPLSPALHVLATTARDDRMRRAAKAEQQAQDGRELDRFEQMRDQGVADLDAIVRQMVTQARGVLGNDLVLSADTHHQWSIMWQDIGLHIVAQRATGVPRFEQLPLVVGAISTIRQHPDEPFTFGGPAKANLLYRHDAGRGRWTARKWSFNRGPTSVGVSPVARLWELLIECSAPGPKVLDYTAADEPLTADYLVQQLTSAITSTAKP